MGSEDFQAEAAQVVAAKAGARLVLVRLVWWVFRLALQPQWHIWERGRMGRMRIL